jgi:transposase
MRIVFGIDVSKASSHVAVAIEAHNDAVIQEEFSIGNNVPGFNELLTELESFREPEIVFEATGVYSRRLNRFLTDHGYDFVQMNPLAAKRQLDNQVRGNKNDTLDARNLALTHFQIERALFYQQRPIYGELQGMSRYYAEVNDDIVRNKNRMHKALQSTFPEIENVTSDTDGKLYWHLVQRFPHATLVNELDDATLVEVIKTASGRNENHARLVAIARKLRNAAEHSYPAVDATSYEIKHVIALAKTVERLATTKAEIIDDMIAKADGLRELEILMSIPGIGPITAVRLIGELGDVRRFKNSNKLNAFVGLDIHQYQSGDKDLRTGISKHGNPIARKILFRAISTIATAAKHRPCHIADYYNERKQLDLAYLRQKKKQSSESIHVNTKKTAISAMNRLIRTIYHLITTDQFYDYAVASAKRN